MKSFIYPIAKYICIRENDKLQGYFAPTMYCREQEKRFYISDKNSKYGIKLFKVRAENFNKAKTDAKKFAQKEIDWWNIETSNETLSKAFAQALKLTKKSLKKESK